MTILSPLPFNGSLCDELLNGKIFYSLAEAKMLIQAGGGITTPSALTAALDIDHLPRIWRRWA